MKKIITTMICFVFLASSFGTSFAQENTMQFMASQSVGTNNCPISHAYSNRLYVPASIKIYHDATPDFIVKTNSSTINSQINPIGSDNNVYIENVPNSTASFTIQVSAKYHDGKEHPFSIEYWSQNQPVFAEQHFTLNSDFCRTIMIDTGQAPVVPDIGLTVQKITQSLLGQFVSVVSQNTVTLYYFLVIVGIILALLFFLLLMIMIKLGNYDSGKTATEEKMTFLIKKFNNAISLYENNSNLNSLENARMIKEIDGIKQGQQTFLGQFANTLELRLPNLIQETLEKMRKEKQPKQIPKPIETPSTETKEEPIFKTPEEIISEPKSIKEKIVDTIKYPFAEKPEKPIKTLEEFYEIWSKEENQTKLGERYAKVNKEWEKLAKENKNYDEVRNESLALHKILMGRTKIE